MRYATATSPRWALQRMLDGWLAVTDNARYASAKRAVARVENAELPLAKLAKQWYNAVRVQTFGGFAALLWMARASSSTGVMRAGAAFMAANVAFFLLGAGNAKHDKDGLPAPMKRELQKFVLTTDLVLFGAAFARALAPAGSMGRAVLAGIFSAGCLIGAVEGVPMTVASLRALLAM